MDGAERIKQERARQVGLYDEYHDRGHEDDELVMAAVIYALPPHYREEPFDLASPLPGGLDQEVTLLGQWWPGCEGLNGEVDWLYRPGDRIRELTKAGALIAAEIDRLLLVEGEQSG